MQQEEGKKNVRHWIIVKYVNLVHMLCQRVRIPVNTQVTHGNYMILSTIDFVNKKN